MNGRFIGQHVYTIDPQRRLPLPREWRPEERMLFYLIPGREQVVHVMTEARFEAELMGEAEQGSWASAQDAHTLRAVGSRSHRCYCDRQGRITLTPLLLEHAGLTDRAVVIGAFTTIQILSPENWQADNVSTDATLDHIERMRGRRRPDGDRGAAWTSSDPSARS
jgi:MraZ protein